MNYETLAKAFGVVLFAVMSFWGVHLTNSVTDTNILSTKLIEKIKALDARVQFYHRHE